MDKKEGEKTKIEDHEKDWGVDGKGTYPASLQEYRGRRRYEKGKKKGKNTLPQKDKGSASLETITPLGKKTKDKGEKIGKGKKELRKKLGTASTRAGDPKHAAKNRERKGKTGWGKKKKRSSREEGARG